ncbi:MAG: PAS domain S-box protein, partial [Verrucomicrobiota bacterium]
MEAFLHPPQLNLPGAFVYQYVLTADRQSRFTYIDRNITQVHGRLTAEEIMKDASLLLDQISPECRESYAAAMEDSRRDLSNFEHDLRLQRSDGQVRWLHFQSHPQRLPDGSTVWDGVAIDITRQRETEESLRLSEALYADTINALNDGIWDLDNTTGRLFFSPIYYQLLGCAPAEIPADYNGWRSLVHPDDLASVDRVMAKGMQTGTAEQCEMRMRLKSGAWKWVQSRGKVVKYDSQGRPLRMIGTLSDIAERKQAEESKAILAAVVETTEDAIISKDLEGIVTSWNQGAEKIFGYAAGEIVGSSILKIIPTELCEEEQRILETIRSGKSVSHFETSRLTKDGRLIDVSVTASPIRDAAGHITGISKVVRDNSERKKAEQQLHRLNRALHARSLCSLALFQTKTEDELLKQACEILVKEAGYRLVSVA